MEEDRTSAGNDFNDGLVVNALDNHAWFYNYEKRGFKAAQSGRILIFSSLCIMERQIAFIFKDADFLSLEAAEFDDPAEGEAVAAKFKMAARSPAGLLNRQKTLQRSRPPPLPHS